MFFGALDAQSDPTSRAAACGHLTSHGDGFIANAASTFTYEVKDVSDSGSSPRNAEAFGIHDVLTGRRASVDRRYEPLADARP
jgi:hypothetical protein